MRLLGSKYAKNAFAAGAALWTPLGAHSALQTPLLDLGAALRRGVGRGGRKERGKGENKKGEGEGRGREEKGREGK